jgi:glycosyltransferase involved in cell wall biosynthesis
MDPPVLSAVCLLGSRRERLPRLGAAIAAQTAADELEFVVVGGGEEPVPLSDRIRSMRVPWPPGLSLGEARAAGAREASGEIVAFLLDHCYPEPGWAEALIAAYRDRPWSAVGYGFRNANPDTYASRATFLAHFGAWAGEDQGEAARLPGLDVSYRRRELLALGPDLGQLLDIDSSVHRRFRSVGLSLALEPRAVVAEECFDSVIDACRANAVYARMLAVRRAKSESWSRWRRLAGALAALPVGTVVRLARIWRGSKGRRGELLRCLPPLTAICLGWALGEAGGYLFGEGRAPGRLVHWELEAIRAHE